MNERNEQKPTRGVGRGFFLTDEGEIDINFVAQSVKFFIGRIYRLN
jgi:hypothetical protein